MKKFFILLLIVTISFVSKAQTTVSIDSVVKTNEGNVVYYSYCTDGEFYDFSGWVSAKSTNNKFKVFASPWCKQCMTLPCGAGSFTDGWNRKEERTYQIRIILNGTEPVEERTFYSNTYTVSK
jgi:hypothetical protein